MKTCSKCGKELNEQDVFCPSCGTPVEPEVIYCTNCGKKLTSDIQFCPECGASTKESEEKTTGFAQVKAIFQNVKDETASMNPEDVKKNAAMAVISYIGILVLIPIFAAKNSKYARFHANQGLILFLADVIWVVGTFLINLLLGRIPLIGNLFSSITTLGYVAMLAYMILGIVHAAKGTAKELPFIGKFRLIS